MGPGEKKFANGEEERGMLVLEEIMRVEDSFLYEVYAAKAVCKDSKGRDKGDGGRGRCMGMAEGSMDAPKFSSGDSVSFTFPIRVDSVGGAIECEIKGSPDHVGTCSIRSTSSVGVVCWTQWPCEGNGGG